MSSRNLTPFFVFSIRENKPCKILSRQNREIKYQMLSFAAD